MSRIGLFFTLFTFLVFSGCTLPQWRVFQAKVPAPLAKPLDQTEFERRAAELLARRIEKPEALKPVAQQLSASLGAPAKPITEPDVEKASALSVDELQRGMAKMQAQLALLNRRLATYQGKEIEGTGFNLAGPTGLLSIAGIVALCIFVPGFLTFVLFVIRRLRGTIQQMAQAVEEYQVERPAEGRELKEWFSSAMDRGAKAIVKREKRYMDTSNLEELRRERDLQEAAA